MDGSGTQVSVDLPPLPSGQFLFVSYASVDRVQVLGIADALRTQGLELWIDQVGIAGGAAYGTEIANAIKASAAVVLMCSTASLASRNVRQEIMLAWRYDRPIVPLLLEPTTFPDDIAYWLEGAQWIEVRERSADVWIPELRRALNRHGFTIAAPVTEGTGAADQKRNASLEVPGNLPKSEGAIIGRERETRELLALLGQGRWVTLTGPGGTGKTRLAFETARRASGVFAEGVWFVDLADTTDPAEILPKIAEILGVEEVPNVAMFDLVADQLRDGSRLLLLDNLEQVATGASQIASLLESCEGLVILATSRVPLRVAGEWIYMVEPLGLPDLQALPPLPVLSQFPAIKLFSERAREARKDFVLTEGMARPVAEICHRLDGLPLAIELAAARVRLLPPATILTRLGSRLNLLTRGTASSARQQTLRDTISWSHGLLSPVEQVAFRWLSVFAGGATVEAGESVMASVSDGAAPTLDDISELINHSLLRTEMDGADSAPRVRMLETIREYALEQLVASGEEPKLRRAHAEYFRECVLASEADLLGPQPDTSLQALRFEDENLRASLAWFAANSRDVDPDAELQMVAALVRYWRRRGRYQEADEKLRGALERSPNGDPNARAKVFQGAGFIAARRGDGTAARTNFEASLNLRREIGDRTGEANSLQNLAELAEESGDFSRATSYREEVLAVRVELGDELGVATAKHDLGVVALYRGDYEEAIARFSESLPFFRRSADARNLAESLNLLAGAEMLSGQGDAARHAEESLALWRTLDDRHAMAYALVNYGRALQLSGRHDEAVPVLGQGYRECLEQGDTGGVSLALYGLGLIAFARGDQAGAFQQFAESLRLSHAAEELWHVAERIEALAAIWVDRGDAKRAARGIGGAALLRKSGGFPIPPAEMPDFERTMIAIRQRLSEVEFEAERAAGEAMPVKDIVAEALGVEAY